MKRIALITLHTPTATNYGGASALPYHLIKSRPKDIEIVVWSFNSNRCDNTRILTSEAELGVKIHILEMPICMKWLASKYIRLFLSRPYQDYLSITKKTINEINNYLRNDLKNGVWVYGEELAGLARKFPGYKIVVTTPDCEALYYQRMFGMPGVGVSWKWLLRYALMYRRYCRHTALMPASENITYHLVGKEDQVLFEKLNHDAKSVFIRHPHYDIGGVKIENKQKGKFKILIAGRNNIYMASAVEEATKALEGSANDLKAFYGVTFLGQGWDMMAHRLSAVGYETKNLTYVEDYVAEIKQHDMQLTPISVGTGTKGKVLDAFANGLMVIGTPLALENISVENRKSCFIYETGDELVAILKELSLNREIVDCIAEAGKNAVLQLHGREQIAHQVFAYFC